MTVQCVFLVSDNHLAQTVCVITLDKVKNIDVDTAIKFLYYLKTLRKDKARMNVQSVDELILFGFFQSGSVKYIHPLCYLVHSQTD